MDLDTYSDSGEGGGTPLQDERDYDYKVSEKLQWHQADGNMAAEREEEDMDQDGATQMSADGDRMSTGSGPASPIGSPLASLSQNDSGPASPIGSPASPVGSPLSPAGSASGPGSPAGSGPPSPPGSPRGSQSPASPTQSGSPPGSPVGSAPGSPMSGSGPESPAGNGSAPGSPEYQYGPQSPAGSPGSPGAGRESPSQPASPEAPGSPADRSRSPSPNGSPPGSPVQSGPASPTQSGSPPGSPASPRSRSGSPAGSARSRSGSPAGSVHSRASRSRSRSGSPARSARSRSGSPAGSQRSRSGSPAGSLRSRSGSPAGSQRSRSGSAGSRRSRSGSAGSQRSRSGSPGSARSRSASPAGSARSRSGSWSGRSRSRSASGSPARSRSGSPARSGSGRSRSVSPARSGSRSRSRSASGSPARSRSGSPASRGSRSRSGSPAGSDRSRSRSGSRGRSRSRSRSLSGSRSRSRSASAGGTPPYSPLGSPKSPGMAEGKAGKLKGSDDESDKEDLVADIFGSSDEEEEFEGFGEADVEATTKKKEKKSAILSDDDDEGLATGQTDGDQVLPELSDDENDKAAREDGKDDGDIVSDFDLMMAKKKEEMQKRRRKRKDFDLINDSDDLIADMISKMKVAAEEDRGLNMTKKPAIKKLKYLPTVLSQLKKSDLQGAFLDCGILGAMTEWLAPLPDKSLPNLQIRESFLRLLQEFPSISPSALKGSGIGKAIMYLYKHPKEVKENKDRAGKLINEWSRPLFNLTSNYKSLSKEEREQRDYDQLPKRRRTSMEDGGMTPRKDLDKSLSGEQKALRPGDPGWVYRARVPMPSNKDYVIRPKWKTEEEGMEYSSMKAPAKKEPNRYEKQVRKLVEKKKRQKANRAVTISIEGRNMAL